jgi:methionyl-tRNA formyltransferase
MRIVFIGAVEFSLKALAHLVSLKADVIGVCTSSDVRLNADHADLGAICRENDIPVYHGNDLNSPEALAWVKEKRPDIVFCFGWSRFLKEEMLAIAPHGVVGFHPSALPANRGRHPLIWALVLGLKETASTFFFMDKEADSGNIISQRSIEIGDDDDVAMIYQKVTDTALEQLTELMENFASGAVVGQAQDSRQANSWRKRSKKDGEIDWRMSALSIRNLVRGLSRPYVGAHFAFDGREIKVWKAAVRAGAPNNIEPGKVFAFEEGHPVIKCGHDAICLLETEGAFEPGLGDYL